MPETPNVVLELTGGSEDGAVWEGGHVLGYYWQAKGGQVGARFRVIPDYTIHNLLRVTNEEEEKAFPAPLCEVYEVTERREEWDHVHLWAKYLGRESEWPVDDSR